MVSLASCGQASGSDLASTRGLCSGPICGAVQARAALRTTCGNRCNVDSYTVRTSVLPPPWEGWGFCLASQAQPGGQATQGLIWLPKEIEAGREGTGGDAAAIGKSADTSGVGKRSQWRLQQGPGDAGGSCAP